MYVDTRIVRSDSKLFNVRVTNGRYVYEFTDNADLWQQNIVIGN